MPNILQERIPNLRHAGSLTSRKVRNVWVNIVVPSSGVNEFFWTFWRLKYVATTLSINAGTHHPVTGCHFAIRISTHTHRSSLLPPWFIYRSLIKLGAPRTDKWHLELNDHMVGHPCCVFINYIWLNQLSNTTNLWWIDVYYIVIKYMFRRLWPSSGWWINKKHICSYVWHASFLRRMGGGVIRWGYEISCVLGREGVYMSVYCADLVL